MSTDVAGTTTAKRDEQPSPWIPDDRTFGARLAMVRWQRRWNVKEAALACGVAAASWRLWEFDGAQPRNLMEISQKIADRTGCDLAWLVGGAVLRSRVGAGGQNSCSVTKTNGSHGSRPNGRPEPRTPLAVSADRPSSRRPQRVTSVTRPMSPRVA